MLCWRLHLGAAHGSILSSSPLMELGHGFWSQWRQPASFCGWGLVPPSKCYLGDGDVGDNGKQAYLATVLAELAGPR